MSEIPIKATCHISIVQSIHLYDHFRQWSQIHLISRNPLLRSTKEPRFFGSTSLKTTKTIEHKCLASNLNIKMIYIRYNNPERFHIPSGIALMAYCHECVIRSNSPSCSSPSHITFVNRSLTYVPCSHAKYEILEIILRINILAKGKTTVPRQKKGKLS